MRPFQQFDAFKALAADRLPGWHAWFTPYDDEIHFHVERTARDEKTGRTFRCDVGGPDPEEVCRRASEVVFP